MPEANYEFMYAVSRSPDGLFTVPGETPTQDVNFSSSQSSLSPGDEISIGGAGTLDGNYDYVGSVASPDGSAAYIVYNVANQNFYMLSNDEIVFGSNTSEPLGTLTSSGPGSGAPVCFMAGTRILMFSGAKNIEDLKPGDVVLTADGRTSAVRWIGRQTVLRAFADETSLPVRIRKDALGENVPSRDLLVSQQHALFVDGVLIQAGALINGATIVRERNVSSKFVFYHIELDDHSLVLAENTPAESFVDNVDRAHFDNWHEYQALYPNGKAVAEMPYPRAKAHRQVPAAIRARLAERAVDQTVASAA